MARPKTWYSEVVDILGYIESEVQDALNQLNLCESEDENEHVTAAKNILEFLLIQLY